MKQKKSWILIFIVIISPPCFAQKIFYSSVTDAVKTWNSGDSLHPTDQGFPRVPQDLVFAAGNTEEQANDFIANVDSAMRENYDKTIKMVGDDTFPILYAEATPDGGIYHLLINQSEWVSARPVPPLYQQVKSISHIPLGIFSIIAPYTKDPSNAQWEKPLEKFKEKIQLAKDHLKDANMPKQAYEDNLKILNASINYINETLKNKTFTINGFSNYSYKLGAEIGRNQNLAAQLQVYAFTQVLLKWKKMIGEEAWSRMYVVCSALWTLSRENVHELIIRNTIPPEQANSHVIVTSMPIKNLDEARKLIGRIVNDRVMAAAVLSSETERGRENLHSLSTSRDLISVAAMEAIKDMDAKIKDKSLFPESLKPSAPPAEIDPENY